MSTSKLNPTQPNNFVGFYPRSGGRRAVAGTSFGETASWLHVKTAGVILVHNSFQNHTYIHEALNDETIPIFGDIIKTSETIDGTPETTTASGFIWYGTGDNANAPRKLV